MTTTVCPPTAELLTAAKAAYSARLAGGDVEEVTIGGVSTRFGSLTALKRQIDQMEVLSLMEQGGSRPSRISLPGRYS